MAVDDPRETPLPAPDRLPPAPREVTSDLRWRLIFNPVTFGSGIACGITGLLAALAIAAVDPVSMWRLAHNTREAKAAVQRVEWTGSEVNGRLVDRYTYTFQLADGTVVPGVSYGRRPIGAQLRRQPDDLTVEYDPSQPRVNRLKGTTTGPLDTSFLVLGLIPPVIAYLIFGAGIRDGLRKIDLLANGALAQGRITTCRLGSESNAREVPFDEFRTRWLSRQPDQAQTPDQGADPGGASATPEQRLIRGTAGLVTCGAWGVWILGLLVVGGLTVAVLFTKTPLLINGKPASHRAAVLFVSLFSAVWVGFGLLMLGAVKRYSKVFIGQGSPMGLVPHPRLSCEFEFTVPGGETIRARDTITFSRRLGDEPTEPVLYDPSRPRRAFLLDGENLPIRLSPFREWEAEGGPRPGPRAIIVALCMVGGPILGWAIWAIS